jgi:nitroreductase
MKNNIVLENIHKRRSIRNYSLEQIPNETLNQIIEAGQFAPSGGNNQTSHFIVIQNKEVLAQLKILVEHEFAEMEIQETTYKNIVSSIRQSKKGNYDFTYNAPTFIIIANQQNYGNAMADCSVALENMMLAAVSLEVGTCWINQLHWLDEDEAVREFLLNLGLKENETICGSLSLGFSLQKEFAPLKRTGNLVTYIR